MGVGYYPVKMFGVYLGEQDLLKFLAKHGYHLDEDEWDEVGVELVSSLPGLEEFEFFSASAGGYTSYFGISCDTDEEAKPKFEKAFPNIKDAKLLEFCEVL